MKIITLLIVTLSLQGCGLGLLTNLAGGGDAPSISANVGENVETNEGISAKNNSDAFNNYGDVNNTKADMIADTITNIEDIPFWVWVLMILGWMLPSPKEIGSGIVSVFEYFIKRKWR